MFLVAAEGSSGSYMIDEDGQIYAYSRPFWLPTTQVEKLDDGAREILEVARRRRDLAVVVAEHRAEIFADLEALQADLVG